MTQLQRKRPRKVAEVRIRLQGRGRRRQRKGVREEERTAAQRRQRKGKRTAAQHRQRTGERTAAQRRHARNEKLLTLTATQIAQNAYSKGSFPAASATITNLKEASTLLPGRERQGIIHSYAVTVTHARRANLGAALRNEHTFAVPRNRARSSCHVDGEHAPICREPITHVNPVRDTTRGHRSNLSPITHVNPVRRVTCFDAASGKRLGTWDASRSILDAVTEGERLVRP